MTEYGWTEHEGTAASPPTTAEPGTSTDERPEATSLPQIADAVGRTILDQVEQRPYTTVLVAVAAGYVLGRGTPRWVTDLAWTVGSRVAVARLVTAMTQV